MAENFTWLHLSDLHAGMHGQSWLWPRVKDVVHDDISRVFERTGPWDVVIFSGDLTQRGLASEFEDVTKILEELWGRFRQLGFAPRFFAVPGNHDLVRPAHNDPGSLLLNRYWEEELVRENTWSDTNSVYRKTIKDAFSAYTNWHSKLSDSGVPILDGMHGIMPGDVASVVELENRSLGLIGLNSAWLQLGEGKYRERLCVDVRQLHAVTGGDPGKWAGQYCANLIVTHHPTEWLHATARSQWDAEISPANRFKAHLCGHMHEPDVTVVSHGGTASRQSIQAASIFGLEKVGDLELRRIHGYAVCRIGDAAELRVWPRRSKKQKSGDWKLVPDHEFDLDNTDSFLIVLNAGTKTKPVLADDFIDDSEGSHDPNAVFPKNDPEALEKLRHFIPPSSASARVRRIEQHLCANGLSEARAIWIVSEWGCGSDGFIRAIQEQLKLPTESTFRLDVSDFTSGSMLPELIKSKYGFSFSTVCDALADAGRALLILDDAPTSISSNSDGKPTVEIELEEVATLLINYCSDLRVVIRTRAAPHMGTLAICTLKPLDEADLRVYIADHDRGGAEFITPDAISAIFRHTDGVPARVDTTLRELELITIDELAKTNTDLGHGEAGLIEAPVALTKAVSEFAGSNEPDRQRSYLLLKALTAFPSGEALERIKRFYGAHPLFPNHARELLSNSLIVTTGAQSSPMAAEPVPKLLVVPRSVRDYVRSRISRDDQHELTIKAANLYFGEKWKTGEIRVSLGGHFSTQMASPTEIANATSIVLRLLHDAVDSGDDLALAGALQLAKAYISLLREGDHYRAVVTLAKDVLSNLGDEQRENITAFNIELAKALRMVGDVRGALNIFDAIDIEVLPASRRQSVLLTKALAYQSLDEADNAVAAAKLVIKVDRHNEPALQARAIILEVGEKTDETPEELRRIEVAARKKKALVTANNLAISRAGQNDITFEEKDRALEDVIGSVRESKDYYNVARAIIARAEAYRATNRVLTQRDRRALIVAYHYLLSERLPNLFNRCHVALWHEFERDGQIDNLFRLFRHSSFIWRLRGDDKSEEKFLRKLATRAQAVITREFRRLTREMAYFVVRQTMLGSSNE